MAEETTDGPAELSAEHAAVLDAFVRHLTAERNLSAHTVRAYRGDLAHLLGHLERTALKKKGFLNRENWLYW